ncbi:putative integral membrane protein [Streptomyces lividans 1326]|uniref:Putative integral membrane protein n=1 Tax=Streptomyces lividans 1326 TaxID=1200984 RepID=A0A7U9DQT5_STRLI|nr:putative integral membrane protein [Streptomyces lividans 1326]
MLAAAFAAQAVGALMPHVPLLLAASAGSLAAEGVLYRWQRGMVSLFAKSHADVTVRHVLRDLLLVVGLLRLGEQHREGVYAPLVAGLLVLYALHWSIQAVSVLVRRTRTLPVVTRNIDASALRLTPAPPVLLRRPGPRLAVFGLPATAGLLATAATDAPLYGVAGLALSLGAALTGLGALLLRLLPGRRPAGEQEVLDWFDAWLARYRPTVGLYFSGGASSAYQANMWLEPLARLDGPAGDRAAGAAHGAADRGDRHSGGVPAEGVHADAPGALDAPGPPPPLQLRQDLAGPAHPDDQARLRQPRGERQAVLVQPVREGVRRGVGGGPPRRASGTRWRRWASRTRTWWRSAARSWTPYGRTRGRPRRGRSRPSCTRRPGRAGTAIPATPRWSRPGRIWCGHCSPTRAYGCCTSRIR